MDISLTSYQVRPLMPSDRAWVARHMAEQWGAEIVVVHGAVYHAAGLPGFVAEAEDAVGVAGLLTYHLDGDACEVVTIDSLRPGIGVGTALIEAVKQAAREAGCRRLWLITTNDNTDALRFYQKRSFVLVAVYRDAVAADRAIKPEIPLIGNDGIPIRDEIELELALL